MLGDLSFTVDTDLSDGRNPLNESGKIHTLFGQPFRAATCSSGSRTKPPPAAATATHGGAVETGAQGRI